ncbi:unnamed protein product [Protopolystoma xenopodis]|uniref:Uncharacterized protein n=1 Tax=Protopolystoma xenopodis TaxID=117903 RepID=A0A448XFP1_9PLAT|nr:unnamed protein product [Protopolystoma xenopodis]
MLTMAPFTDNAGETFRNVPSHWFDAGHHEDYARGYRTWLIPLRLFDATTKLQGRDASIRQRLWVDCSSPAFSRRLISAQISAHSHAAFRLKSLLHSET